MRPVAARKQKLSGTGKRVAIAAGGGLSHEEIALALGIERGELEEKYAWELSVGAHLQRLELVEALHKAALKGNVAAAKAYTSLSIKAAAPPVPEPEEEKPEPLGKKAQRNANARTAQEGTEWESLLRPVA